MRRPPVVERPPAWVVLLAASVLVRVPVPLVRDAFAALALAQMLLLAAAALAWARERAGAPRAVAAAAVALAAGLVVEVVGSRTGWPFGDYAYAGSPPPTLLEVPLLVPLGWFATVLAAHVLARGRWWLTGLLVVAWDLGLEALMTAEGYWTWAPEQVLDPLPTWYGAPVQNFVAWFAVGAGLSLAFSRLVPLGPSVDGSRGSFGWAYRVEAWFLPVGLAWFGLWPAALACGVAMNSLDVVRWARRPASLRRGPARRLAPGARR